MSSVDGFHGEYLCGLAAPHGASMQGVGTALRSIERKSHAGSLKLSADVVAADAERLDVVKRNIAAGRRSGHLAARCAQAYRASHPPH